LFNNQPTPNLLGGTISRPGGRLYPLVIAAALGSCFEAYDLFLVGTMAVVIGKQFFAGVNPAAALIFALLGFAAGFLARPFGAMVFGSLGDRLGRKRVFIVTVGLMGLATILIGLLPTYASVGVLAPVLFVGLRLLQGFALGGENGGAMVYVAEHVPENRRGYYTCWLQMSPIVGLILSQLVVQTTRTGLGETDFLAWGWRIPFVVSLALLALSLWMRSHMGESPEFEELRHRRETSRTPLRESLTGRSNIAAMILSTFGLNPASAVAFYAGFFYTTFFLTQVLGVAPTTVSMLSMASLVTSIPAFVFFGVLSDRVSRKAVLAVGFGLVAMLYPVLFRNLTHYANPALERAVATAPVVVVADPAECSTQFNMLGVSKFTTSCDLAKSALVRTGVNYSNEAASPASVTVIKIGSQVVTSYDGRQPNAKSKATAFDTALRNALDNAGYPKKAAPDQINQLMIYILLSTLSILAAMTYAPLAATLAELFPARIRYSALSLSYQVGFGWAGGFLPAAAFAIVAAEGNMYAGLAYPRVFALIGVAFVIVYGIASRMTKSASNT
jgi:MFS family permease